MKTILAKNCIKKVKPSVQKKVMIDIGTNAYVNPTPKIPLSIHKAKGVQN